MSRNFECHICDRITRNSGSGAVLPLCTFCKEAWQRGAEAGQALGEKLATERIVAFLDKRVDWHWQNSQNDPDADQRAIHQSRGAGVEFAQMDIEKGEHLHRVVRDHIASCAHDAGAEGVPNG